MFKIDVKKYESIIGALGNVFEWYNYALVMPFAVVLMQQFFPENTSAFGKICGGLIVSMGLFLRPLGAFVFGPIGDKFGRQKAISWSVLLMAIPTILMGLIPGYKEIGILAPILLIFLRILQGISLGGEYTAAMVHIVERAPAGKKGFYGCWTEAGSQMGVLLAGQSVVWISSLFPESEVYSFMWRIPFLFGIILVPFAFLIPDQELKENKKISIIHTLRLHLKEVFCTIAITSFSAVAFYTLWTFLPGYLVTHSILTLKDASVCGVTATVMSVISILGCGYLSDIFGRKPFLIAGIFGVAITLCIMFLGNFHDFYIWLLLHASYGFCIGTYYSSRAAFFSEAFPKEVRCTAVSVSLSLAQAFFGGLTPIVMVWLTDASEYLAIVPVICVSFFALFALSKLKDKGVRSKN